MLNRFQRFFKLSKALPIFNHQDHHLSSSSSSSSIQIQQNHQSKTLIGSPSRVQKLIASQSDPLLAKEIFVGTKLMIIIFRFIILESDALVRNVKRQLFFNDKEGRAYDACKVLEDMPSNGCLPNLVSYHTLVHGLCDQGVLDEARKYMVEMISKGFAHVSVFHALIKGFCNVGRAEEASEVLVEMLTHGEALHTETWVEILPRVCDEDETMLTEDVLERVLKEEINRDSRIVDVGRGLEEYLI